MVIQAWMKGNSPLKSLKIEQIVMFEMKFISMIWKTVWDNTSDHLWTYLASYYTLLDGLAYRKQLFVSRFHYISLIKHHAWNPYHSDRVSERESVRIRSHY